MSSIQTLVSTIMFEQLTEEARTKLLKDALAMLLEPASTYSSVNTLQAAWRDAVKLYARDAITKIVATDPEVQAAIRELCLKTVKAALESEGVVNRAPKVETPVDELKRIAESHESPAVRRAASRNLENMKADPSIADKINSQFKPGEVTSKLESGISDQKNKLSKKVAEEHATHGELDGRGKEFVKLYADKLMADPANDHVLDREHAEHLAEYMTHSLKRGAGGIDSSAIKGVAKDLGIKHGVASIADHLTNGAYSAKKQEEKDAKANKPKKTDDELKQQRQGAIENARKARSEASLDKSVRHNGAVKTRRQWLADLHKDGYRVADTVHPNDKDGSFRATNDGGNSFYNLSPTEAAHMRSLHAAETAKSDETQTPPESKPTSSGPAEPSTKVPDLEGLAHYSNGVPIPGAYQRHVKGKLDEALQDVPAMFANRIRAQASYSGHETTPEAFAKMHAGNQDVIQHANELGDAYRHGVKLDESLKGDRDRREGEEIRGRIREGDRW